MKQRYQQVLSWVGLGAMIGFPVFVAMAGRPSIEVAAIGVGISGLMFLMGRYSAEEKRHEDH